MRRRDPEHWKEQLKDHYLEQVLDAPKFKAFYLRQSPDSRMMSTLFIFCREGIIICGDLSPGNHGAIHGNVSAFGYSLGWFASHLSGDYLCSKFLPEEWQPELAAEWCRDMANEIRRGNYDYRDKRIEEAHGEREELLHELGAHRDDSRNETISANERQEIVAAIPAIREKLPAARAKVKELREELAQKYIELSERVCDDYGVERFGDAVRDLAYGDVDDGVPGYGYPINAADLLCALQQKFAEEYDKMFPEPVPFDWDKLLPGGPIA